MSKTLQSRAMAASAKILGLMRGVRMQSLMKFLGLVILLSTSASGHAAIGTIASASDPVATGTVRVVFKKRGHFLAGCTGAIYSDNSVVTAGHCAIEGRDITTTIEFVDPVDHEIVATRSAADANTKDLPFKSGWYDLRILRFSKGLPPGFHPLALCPKLDLSDDHLAVAYGFGVHSVSYETQMTHTPEETEAQFDTTLRLVTGVIRTIPLNDNKLFLTMKITNDEALCDGDSGGPIMTIQNGNACWVANQSTSSTFGGPCGIRAGLANTNSAAYDKYSADQHSGTYLDFLNRLAN